MKPDSQVTEPQGSLVQASENTPLLCDKRHSEASDSGCDQFDIMPLKYGEVIRGADTIHRAFAEDTMMKYYSSVDTAPLYDLRWRIRHTMTLLDTVHQSRTLTINHGESVLQFSAPGNDQNSIWYTTFFRAWQAFDTPELTKVRMPRGSTVYSDTHRLIQRKSETRRKTAVVVQKAFGDKFKDMYNLEILATAPEARNRGYASALVNTVVGMAAAEGRDVWVVTANASEFYRRLGFVVMMKAILGEDNPTWHGEPIILHVMHKDNTGRIGQ
ncbi:hypothetical protein FKP32DRAFT_1479529 [Trametes sanguinea]|nr:hypothetical protein FKP32DRAFT_1479529 [Trametes sanguinea]